jgi:hypothetical protein
MTLRLVPLSTLAFVFAGCTNQNESKKGSFSSPSGTIYTEYSEYNGKALVGGDMLFNIPKEDHFESIPDGTQELNLHVNLYNSLLWPEGRIPYTTAGGFTGTSEINNAVAQFARTQKVRLVPKTATDKSWIEISYANLPYGTIGTSHVGKIYSSGSHDIQISYSTPSYIAKFNLLHEILHAAGAFHEFQRPDRDLYLDPMIATKFPIISGTNYKSFGAYDYASASHYFTSAYQLIRKKNKSAVPDNPGVLSATDIASLNQLYANAPAIVPEPPPKPNPFAGWFDGVFQNPNGTRYLAGWACRKGDINPITVSVLGLVGYAEIPLGSFPTKEVSEPAIHNICGVQGAFRLKIPMESLHRTKTVPGMKLAFKVEFPGQFDGSIQPLWTHSVPDSKKVVAGYLDSVRKNASGKFVLSGWACSVAYPTSMQVRLTALIGGDQSETTPLYPPSGSKIISIFTPTNFREKAVLDICKTNLAQGFQYEMSSLPSKFYGATVYAESMSADGLFVPLNGSGKFKFPPTP